jgi:lysosomal Pro-X carboxypeptidase
LVVFAEHRYYGESLPFGEKSFQQQNIGYLTSEQALADYAYLITWLKQNRPGASNSPVIVFGGSYGGMLAAWFRMKYPNVVAGAVAASAPIWQPVADCDSYQAITTNTFRKTDPNCSMLIRVSWDAINELAMTTQGLTQLTQIFKLCSPLKNVDDLKDWLIDVYGTIVMVDYPYPANFLAPLPAWPVRVKKKKTKEKKKTFRMC